MSEREVRETETLLLVGAVVTTALICGSMWVWYNVARWLIHAAA